MKKIKKNAADPKVDENDNPLEYLPPHEAAIRDAL